MKVVNEAKGNIYYGMHFYPGVAEYQEPGKDPYRVYLNEDTLRAMDPSFAGRPIFVEHVDEVDENIDELRSEADGWVIESFFNSADGKHWVKFIVVSERGERAIKQGMRLSNAYIPKSFASGGLWNGVSFTKEITGGEFEHLAIVRHPRYEESVVMTPEKFKAYNENNLVELKRLSNSKEKGERKMGLKFWKKSTVENSVDFEGMSVTLPKSGKEISIEKLVANADKMAVDRNAGMADMDHKVKMHDGTYCNVSELMEKHKSLNDELEAMKKKKEDSEESEDIDTEVEEVGDRGGDESLDNEDEGLDADRGDEEAKKAEKKKNALAELAEKKAAAKEKADRVRNAKPTGEPEEVATVTFTATQVERGKALYGSN